MIPSFFEGINFRKRLTVNCVRCSAKKRRAFGGRFGCFSGCAVSLAPWREGETVLDGAGDEVVDADFQAATVDEAFDNGGEFAGIFFAVVSGTSESQIGPAADDLGRGAGGGRGGVAGAGLGGGEESLAAGSLLQRGH